MTGGDLQRLLEAIPNVDERSRVREFLAMTPEHQRVYTYRETAALHARVDERFDHLDTKIEELRRPLWRQALAPVTAFGAVVAALLTPEVPRP